MKHFNSVQKIRMRRTIQHALTTMIKHTYRFHIEPDTTYMQVTVSIQTSHHGSLKDGNYLDRNQFQTIVQMK